MREMVFITGGGGFIGSHLVEYFLERTGYDVAVLDRFDEFAVMRRLDPRVAVQVHDLQNPVIHAGVLEEIAPRIKYVIHAAAGSHVDRSIVDPVGFVSDNVLGTVHLLEYVRAHLKPAKTLIFSTDEVVGPAGPNDEFGEFAPTSPANPYAASKAAAESVALSYANTWGMPITVSRCSNVYGARQHREKFIPLAVERILSGQKIEIHARNGVPSSRLYMHVSDVCRAVQLILEQGDTLAIGNRTGRYNIAGKEEYSNVSVVEMLSHLLGQPVQYELVEFVTNRPAFDLRYRITWDRLRELGWTPRVSLEAGLRSVCAAALEAA